MRENVLRVVMAAVLALLAAPAGAHEFECEKDAGLLQVGEDGLVLGEDGLPVFVTTPAPVLRISEYPATVGFEITLRNLAQAISVVRLAGDPLLESLGASARWFGTAIEPGLEVPVGGSARTIAAVMVRSQAECLQLFEGGTFDAPVCQDVVENRFFVEHDVGSAECRARVVCAPQAPPPCETAWGGPKALEFATPTRDIAVDAGCNVNVTGSTMALPLPPLGSPPTQKALLARLNAAGGLDQLREFSGYDTMVNTGTAIAVDGAGNRFVGWHTGWQPSVDEVSRFGPDGTETWRQQRIFGAMGGVDGIALDAMGNPHVAGTSTVEGVAAAKLDAVTGAVLWKWELPAVAGRASGIAIDPNGDVLVASHGYVAKLDPDGSPIWGFELVTVGSPIGAGIGTDSHGNVYLAMTRVNAPAPDTALLMKVDPDGDVVWDAEVGATGPIHVTHLAVSADGSAWLVGSVTGGAIPGEDWGGATDAFVARYDTSGVRLWVKQFGTAENEIGEAVGLDPIGNGFVTYDSGEKVLLDGGPRFTTRRYVMQLDRDGNLR